VSLPQFVHLAPRSLEEACGLLARYGAEARVLAGGTDLLVKMKQRRLMPRYVVNIKRIPGLDYVDYQPGTGLRIGALASLEALNRSVAVRKEFPVLHDAVSTMGTIEIRNRATVAGNVCNASPAAETVPSFMLLAARAKIIGLNGTRSVPFEALFTGPGRTVLAPGELLAEIEVPEPSPLAFGAYDKFSLRRMDLAVVGTAVMLTFDGEACRSARIVLSAVAPTAIRVPAAEAMLEGRSLDERVIQAAAREAAAQASPKADLSGTVETKRAAAEALVVRVLKRALDRAGKRGSS
jgi:aerobic carbon-monoxide dehydrogenase medium subunit